MVSAQRTAGTAAAAGTAPPGPLGGALVTATHCMGRRGRRRVGAQGLRQAQQRRQRPPQALRRLQRTASTACIAVGERLGTARQRCRAMGEGSTASPARTAGPNAAEHAGARVANQVVSARQATVPQHPRQLGMRLGMRPHGVQARPPRMWFHSA